MAEKQNETKVENVVQQVRQGHLTEALTEVNNFYKGHSAASSEQFTNQLFSQIKQDQLCPLIAAGVFRKGSDVLTLTDRDNNGLDDRELKQALSNPKLSPLERMTASFMLLNSEQLAGDKGRITPESLADAAKRTAIPPLELVPGPGPDSRDKTKVSEGRDQAQKPTLAEARKELLDEARKHGVEISKLNSFMQSLESRSAEGKQEGLKAPDADKLAQTYKTFTEMLTGPTQQNGLSERDRAYLVTLSMRNLAFPDRIDQGFDMCPVGTLEILTASYNPQSYAKLMKEVSLTGEFTTSGGKRITVPPEAIKPGEQQFKFNTENVGQNRWQNWASEIFQETAANSVVPFLPQDSRFPAHGKPHTGGKTDMMLDQIQMASEAISGTRVPYFENRHAPSAQELLELRQAGNFPVGIHTVHVADSAGGVWGLHVQTLQDFRIRNGQSEVYLDNQRGSVQDVGWIPLPDLYRYQQLSVPNSHYYLPPGASARPRSS